MSPRRLRRIAVGIRLARLAYAVSLAEVHAGGSSTSALDWRLRSLEHLRRVWPHRLDPVPFTDRVRLPATRRAVRRAHSEADEW